MDLSIIIPSFNTQRLLKECLDSIERERKRAKKRRIEIIVVDNGSTDSSVKYLKKINGKNLIRVIFLNQNLGFSKAVNQGIKKARGRFILLLNSDTQILKGTLEKTIKFAQKHSQSIIGLQLINPNGSIQPSVYHFPSIIGAIKEFWLGKKGSYQKYYPRSRSPIRVEAVTGAAMIIPQEVIKKIGLLDEKYYFYFEDLDYCRRARKKGIAIYYLPSAKVLHYHGASGAAISGKTHQWLVEGSKKFNGLLKYYLLTLILWGGQKWRRFLFNQQNL